MFILDLVFDAFVYVAARPVLFAVLCFLVLVQAAIVFVFSLISE